MTGVFGGTVTGSTLDEMAGLLSRRPDDGRELFEEGDLGLGLLHRGTQLPGDETVEGPEFRGVVYGTISNRDDFGRDVAEIVERVLAAPSETLAALEGPFLIAALDTTNDRIVVATDKLGSRPLYYRAEDGFAMGSELKTVLATMDEIAIDERSLADLLSMGYVWGEKTLVSGVRRLPPATALVYDDGEGRTTRYWKPNFDPASPSLSYMGDLVERYDRATTSVARSVRGNVGLWLADDLDSRALAGSLLGEESLQFSLSGYTFDSNSPDGNRDLTIRTGEATGIPVEEISVDADLRETVAEIVAITDGMIQWTDALDIAAIGSVESPPEVVLDTHGQGALLGERVWRPHLTLAKSPVDSMRRSEVQVDPASVREVLAGDVDPLGSFERAAARSNETGLVPMVMDAHFQNHYAGHHFVRNLVTRAYADTRTPLTHGPFLAHVARLPVEYHLGSLPFTSGKVPFATTRPKLELVQALDPGLAAIPYDRTKLAPSHPSFFHTGSYVVSRGARFLRERLVGPDGPRGPHRFDESFGTFLDGLLDDAKKRPFFDADAIAAVQQDYEAGTDVMNLVAPITTVEQWLQQLSDVVGSRRVGEHVRV